MTRKSTPPAARRVLVAAHSHPAITKGGAEFAAWRLHEAISATPGRESWFLAGARDGSAQPGSHFSQPFDERQFIYAPTGFDWFKFANLDRHYPAEFAGVLLETAPDIIHFHHHIVLGVESFLHVRRTLPKARTVLTLHEFLAICHNHGQMVKHGSHMLCHESSPRDCNRCYPEFGRGDFFLRKEYVRRFFDLVDHFIAPSRFLADRYIAWGLPEERVSVIENIIPEASAAPAAAPAKGRLRVGYFGQISELKGIGVALDALAHLLTEGETGIEFEVHGDYSSQPEKFREGIISRLADAGPNVRFHGVYENDRVDQLMRAVDVVVVPSLWWENSPVVIQEAMRNRRPVICSDIGGMAEKVRDGVDGFHFPMGSAPALAALLKRLAHDPAALTAIQKTQGRPATPKETLGTHLALYDRLLLEVGRG